MMQFKKRFKGKRNWREPAYKPRFADYEQQKREWIAAHPNATPEEYQAAIAHIAMRCGI